VQLCEHCRLKCVQLDLEANCVIERDPTVKPLRWHRCGA
jgi:hypothetical protein